LEYRDTSLLGRAQLHARKTEMLAHLFSVTEKDFNVFEGLDILAQDYTCYGELF